MKRSGRLPGTHRELCGPARVLALKDILQYCLQYWFYTSFSPLVLLSSHLSPSLEPSQLCWEPECSNFPSGTPLIQGQGYPFT